MSTRAALSIAVAVSVVLQGQAPAVAADPPAAAITALDYARPENWVCRPDLPASCHDDLSTAVLTADGKVRIERFRPAARPAVDCFYVYPTVSQSLGVSASTGVTEAERRAVRQQAERFSSVCRLYVPFYRQVTATSLRASFPRADADVWTRAGRTAEADVLAAWDRYIAHDNRGRGVIIIGHSQGAAMAAAVIGQRIDGTPEQARLVSAIIPGWGLMVPVGKEVGGTFKTIPACRRDGQTGCVVSFNAKRVDRPIPADRVTRVAGMHEICTNPAALAGGAGMLKPYLSTSGETIIPALSAPQGAWTNPPARIAAPFVTTPGLYSAQCRDDEHGVYLAITTELKPGDRRIGALTGDWIIDGGPEPTMGLHLIDLNLTAGNLVEVMRAQAAAYKRAQNH
jgi:hypothetical protein